MNASTQERYAVQAAAAQPALDEILATLNPLQVQQMASAMLALGAMNRAEKKP